MANINDFKARLKGGGARANQFKVTLPFPGYSAVGGETADLAFLCNATSIPGQNLGTVPVNFRGRQLFLAGDRTFETWSTTVINDTDFHIRKQIEQWMNSINNLETNTGLNDLREYSADCTVTQLDRDNRILREYKLKSCWPTVLGPVELSYDTVSDIETFDITWRYIDFEITV